MKKGLMLVLAIMLVFFFAGNSFAWTEGCQVEQVKQTATGVYARVVLPGGAKVFAVVAPTLENHVLAILLTAQASDLLVDVNIVTGPKIIGAALNKPTQ